jgi:hypothetical protein
MRRPVIFAIALCGLVFATLSTNTFAQSFIDQHINPTTLQVVKIEEDWRLEVGEPDANVTAPQITTTISPQNDLAGIHAIFNVNYQALDQFAPGGMQLQLWNGETPISFVQLRPEVEFDSIGEIVTWTQQMSWHHGRLTFRIENGNSSTWGPFGGTNLLTESVSTSLPNLNGYDAGDSVENSGVTFAANRVDGLVLERVRIYTDDGQVFTVELNMLTDHD